jgi:predicted nucleotidyltransferase
MKELNQIITVAEIKKFNSENYLEQALNEEVKLWVSKNLKNYLEKNAENHDEIEHIIDYLNSPEAPSRLQKMSYLQAKSNADKWLKSQVKKGKAINEKESDIEVFLDFGDGFKIVKLIGENAYKKEGFLMGHCVASYYKGQSEIYSLRDKNNNPHATIEVIVERGKINQVKGKGNGSIHPLYIRYILAFFNQINLEVSSYELERLGYKTLEKETFEKIKNIKGLVFLHIKESDYIYINSVPEL